MWFFYFKMKNEILIFGLGSVTIHTPKSGEKEFERRSDMRYAVTRLDLGVTRLGVGWVLFNSENKAFEETKPREVRKYIQANLVKGLKFMEDTGEIGVDTNFIEDLASKTSVGNYRMVFGGLKISGMQQIIIVTGKHETEDGERYEIVTPYYQRFFTTKECIQKFVEQGTIVGGVNVDENGEIQLLPGVECHSNQIIMHDDVEAIMWGKVDHEHDEEIAKSLEDLFKDDQDSTENMEVTSAIDEQDNTENMEVTSAIDELLAQAERELNGDSMEESEDNILVETDQNDDEVKNESEEKPSASNSVQTHVRKNRNRNKRK